MTIIPHRCHLSLQTNRSILGNFTVAALPLSFVAIVALGWASVLSLAEDKPSSAAIPPSAKSPLAGLAGSENATNFWSFLPLKRLPPPKVKAGSWPATSIDHFILAKLEGQGFTPAPPASKIELIRRVYFDLIGLPPTPEEVREFLNDASRAAYEKVVDRLLNSPHYGERWGQHWLDVVRFAETEGFEYDRDIPDAWRYRNYVIDSFNRDKPYDRFIVEQLAGDEIDPGNHEMQIAAGFHRLGPVRRNAGNQDVASSRNEVLTDRTDIIGAAFIGLTIGCARCHDHKFDPIRQKDYYQMQAFLAATDERNIFLSGPLEQEKWRSKIRSINQEINRLKRSLRDAGDDEKTRLRQKILDLEENMPAPPAAIASIQNVETNRTAIHVLRRGDWESKGERVGMKGPNVLWPEGKSELPPDAANPKAALARWIIDPQNPLTARVMANRIWQHHFGQGLVKTPNDFGKNGDRPSHPELLDHLALQFMDCGWRMKPMHRMIVLSSAYRQSSTASAAASDVNPQDSASNSKQSKRIENPEREPSPSRAIAAAATIDPENRLLWRFNRRRLAAEEIRDAMLAVSGELNRKMAGASVILPVDSELTGQLYKPSQWMVTTRETEQNCRSVYLIAKRNLRLPFMEVFDQPALQTSCGRRETSTHAPQALELLNGRISNVLAEAFARRLVGEAGPDASRQVERAYSLVAGRSPTDGEKQLALRFLQGQPLKEFALALFNLNAFLYVN